MYVYMYICIYVYMYICACVCRPVYLILEMVVNVLAT